ncbi:hypothetical protein, partial [Nocardia seriolae]
PRTGTIPPNTLPHSTSHRTDTTRADQDKHAKLTALASDTVVQLQSLSMADYGCLEMVDIDHGELEC